MIISNKRSSLLTILIWLTLLAICAQISFFTIHGKVSELVDSLVQSSLSSQILHPVILFPLIGFIVIQIISYALFIAWIWFISVSCVELLRLHTSKIYGLGIALWFIAFTALITTNNYLFSDSFITQTLNEYGYYNDSYNTIIAIISISLLFAASLLAFINLFLNKRHLRLGGLFLFLGFLSLSISIYNKYFTHADINSTSNSQPNIIFIGLDSLRPDFTGYAGKRIIHTPNVDSFLNSATHFSEAYTPLARTFPAWVSILTAKYPKHSHARNNLTEQSAVLENNNLAKQLQQAGYETIYATDEKRFSNITKNYGFDQIIGPGMGVNDFLLGGLSDFPLSNLMINTPLGKFLFPYNFGNRAAAITYEPDKFLQLVQSGLAKRHDRPVFLAVHFCISHWPFTWAHDGQAFDATMSERYQSSVEAVDQQLGKLLTLLKNDGMLENTLVVLLSDHGTTVGLPGDRSIAKENYIGAPDKIKLITLSKLDTKSKRLFDTKSFVINTSYGQGTDVLSLKQYHVVLAFKGFGINTATQNINSRASLIDITPTILDFLHLNPLSGIDGISFAPSLTQTQHKDLLDEKPILSSKIKANTQRPLFLESGYSIAEIETNDIFIEKVLKHSIGAYQVNPKNGLVFMNPLAQKSINASKQRAILWGDWLLARYPESTRLKLTYAKGSKQGTFKPYIVGSYYVLANLKTKEWAVGLSSELTKKAPMKELTEKFNAFYGDEI